MMLLSIPQATPRLPMSNEHYDIQEALLKQQWWLLLSDKILILPTLV